jgi:putative thioredoxin
VKPGRIEAALQSGRSTPCNPQKNSIARYRPPSRTSPKRGDRADFVSNVVYLEHCSMMEQPYVVRVEDGSMLTDTGAAAQPADLIKEATTQSFMKDVIEESRRQPVLVDFWAPWCGPCKQLTPILEKAVKSLKGKVKLVKMNIDEHPAIPGQMGIQSIPAVIAFLGGKPADGFLGALPEGQVIAFLERLTKGEIGGEDKELLKEAEAALAGGNPAGAAAIYAEILTETPDNLVALAGLARSYLETGEIDKAKATLAQVPEAKHNEAPIAAARAAIEMAEQAKSLGPIAELEKKVADNPLDYQARFDLALALNSQNRRQEALDQLMEIVRRDRKWNDDGARKQLVQFFEAWGPTDEHTVSGRRQLSSILFA